MQIFGHLQIANIMLEHFKSHSGYILDEQAFRFGNISPDLKIKHFIPQKWTPNYLEHTFQGSYFYVMQGFEKFLENENFVKMDKKQFSYHLGTWVHYFSDFFCFAHNESFEGNILDHVKYEIKLTQYLKACRWQLLEDMMFCDHSILYTSQIIQYFNEEHDYYLSLEGSYKNDIEALFQFLVTMMSSVFYMRKRLRLVA